MKWRNCWSYMLHMRVGKKTMFDNEFKIYFDCITPKIYCTDRPSSTPFVDQTQILLHNSQWFHLTQKVDNSGRLVWSSRDPSADAFLKPSEIKGITWPSLVSDPKYNCTKRSLDKMRVGYRSFSHLASDLPVVFLQSETTLENPLLAAMYLTHVF